MNFYYDPIVGLRYSFMDPVIEFDMGAVNDESLMEKARKAFLLWATKGVIVVDSSAKSPINFIFSITNYITI